MYKHGDASKGPVVGFIILSRDFCTYVCVCVMISIHVVENHGSSISTSTAIMIPTIVSITMTVIGPVISKITS